MQYIVKGTRIERDVVSYTIEADSPEDAVAKARQAIEDGDGTVVSEYIEESDVQWTDVRATVNDDRGPEELDDLHEPDLDDGLTVYPEPDEDEFSGR